MIVTKIDLRDCVEGRDDDEEAGRQLFMIIHRKPDEFFLPRSLSMCTYLEKWFIDSTVFQEFVLISNETTQKFKMILVSLNLKFIKLWLNIFLHQVNRNPLLKINVQKFSIIIRHQLLFNLVKFLDFATREQFSLRPFVIIYIQFQPPANKKQVRQVFFKITFFHRRNIKRIAFQRKKYTKKW